MNQLEGKVAIVTGASHPKGMGWAACRKLAEAGARVVVTDMVRNDEEHANLNARAAELTKTGGEAMAIGVDVTRRGQIDDCVARVKDAFGAIDILFNNAGSPAGAGDFLTLTAQQWDISYWVNLKGVADFCQAVLPIMVEKGGGAIVNNASLAGLGATSGMAAYTATKFAVVGLTKGLAVEFGPQGVRANAVCPGMVWTQMGAQEVELLREEGETMAAAKQRLACRDLVPMERWATADEVADAVVYLASEQASYITGVALPVAGGMAPGL